MTNKKRLLALAMAAAMTMSACGTTTTEKPSETPSTPSTPSAGTETPAAPVEEDKSGEERKNIFEEIEEENVKEIIILVAMHTDAGTGIWRYGYYCKTTWILSL